MIHSYYVLLNLKFETTWIWMDWTNGNYKIKNKKLLLLKYEFFAL